MKIGDKASFSKTVTESDINLYAGLTGDFNAAHINDQKAARGIFGGRIAHGMLSAGFISAVLGTKLPGDGAIYLRQNLNFLKPVLAGDTITAFCKVIEIIDIEKGIYKFETKCINQDGEKVIDGEAIIKYPDICKSQNNKKVEKRQNGTFYSAEELKELGLKKYGYNVLISRNAILYNPEFLEIGNNVRIDDFTTISGRVILGDYIHIAQFCGLYGGSEGIMMDDFSGLSSRVVIYATSNDYSGESMTNPTVPEKYKVTDKNMAVFLQKHVIIGAACVILPGVTIGEGSSVGALSLCSKSLEAWGIYAGSPAKRIKERSSKLLELEEKLRSEEKFGGVFQSHRLTDCLDTEMEVRAA